MRLKNYITELSLKLGTASVKIVKNSDISFTTEWTTDNIPYYMSAIHDKIVGEDAWEIIFMKMEGDDMDIHLGAKHAMEVFSHVVKSILHLVRMKKPQVIFFHGATLRLEKLYKKTAPIIAKLLPQYNYEYEELPYDESHIKNHIFTRKK